MPGRNPKVPAGSAVRRIRAAVSPGRPARLAAEVGVARRYSPKGGDPLTPNPSPSSAGAVRAFRPRGNYSSRNAVSFADVSSSIFMNPIPKFHTIRRLPTRATHITSESMPNNSSL